MKRLVKGPLAVAVILLSIFVLAGVGNVWAVNCSNAIGGPGSCNCGDVVVGNYTFAGNMLCPGVRHGLIIGAAGITIDGAGYTLDGGGAAGRYCTVNSAADGCPNCPCREAADTQCRGGAGVGDCCIDSGILNARGTDNTGVLAGGCNNAAPACQGGCDTVTVKNLYITGWCDGIFMSGDCSNGANHLNPVPGQTVGAGVDSEYRLTGLVIEGNCIKDNGDDCGTQNGADVCDWTTRNFNDGIFLAQVGVNSTTCSTVDLPCLGPSNPCCNVGEGPPHALRNIVRHNKIYNQQGCCCESCPGGNCINLNGGLEERPADPCINGCWYSGCNEIAKNICKNTGCSCVQFHFGTDRNRIHGNYCRGYDYCGISTACDWLDENYIYSNDIKGGDGSGIVVNSPADIWNNFSLNNQPADAHFAHIYTGGAPTEGYGITYADTGGGGPASLIDNTAIGNVTADIAAILGAAPHPASDKNMCQTTVIHTDAKPGPRGLCRYDGGDRLNCKADLNHDCRVWLEDYYIFSDEWTLGADYCCPCPWGE